jgi:outer membrane protein OmpA-like peptidoglycan-associated protein
MEFLEYEAGMSFMWAGPSIMKQVDSGQVVNSWLKNRFDGEIWAGVGIFKRVDLSISMPVTWYQQGMSANGSNAARVGIGGISFIPRINIFDERRGDETTLGLVTEFVAPTMKGNYFGSGTFEFVGKLAMSMTRLNFTMAMNLWYRFVLNDRVVYNVEDDDQLGFAMGLAYQFKKAPVRIMADATVAVPVVRPFFEKEEVFSEAMFGVGYKVWNFVIQVAGGAGMAPGVGVPAGRFLASVAWSTAGTKKVKNREELLQEELDKEAAKKTAAAAALAAAAAAADGNKEPAADANDKCPDQDEDIDEFEDEDGCPDLDNDADGVPDEKDRCRNQAGPAESEGCPLKDTDGDGVMDHLDKCPDKAGTTENLGCPAPEAAIPESDQKLDKMLGQMVMFSFNSAVINPRFYSTLDNIADQLKKAGNNETVVLEGHTSLKGPRDLNMNLSEKRALAVKKYLIGKGIPTNRIVIKALGAASPIIPEASDSANPLNQRVQFRVIIGGE